MDQLIRQIDRALQKIERDGVDRHNQLVEQFNNHLRQQAKGMRDERVEKAKEFVTGSFEKSVAYTNLIVIAGYVAFFSMWGSVKDDLPRTWMLFAGLLMTISVMLFIAFEIYKMIASGISNKKIIEILKTDQSDSAIPKINQIEHEFETNMYSFWLYILIPTVITGLGAGAIVGVCFAQQLLSRLLG